MSQTVIIIDIIAAFIAGFCLAVIVESKRRNAQLDVAQKMLKDLKKNISNQIKNLEELTDDNNPLLAMHDTLVNDLGMPASKVLLHENKKAIAVAYGKASAVLIEIPVPGTISVGVVSEKLIDIPEEEKMQEIKDLRNIVESCNFDSKFFTKSLSDLTIKLYEIDKKMFSDISRQIPPNML